MSIFTTEEDIKSAKTLSSEFYLKDEFFEKSKEAIFARSWQLIDPDSEGKKLTPKTLLDGFIDEPILLICNKNDKRRCVSNVCTHRGKILVDEASDADGIRCCYHGRCFSTEGKFISMPEFDETENFPTKADDLREIPVNTWQDFVFVSLNPMMPFQDLIGEMTNQTVDFEFSALEFVSRKDYEVEAHWALYCENYLEGLHIPYVHKSLNREIDYRSYATELFRYSNLQTGFDERGMVVARYYFLFPNMMFNFYPWGLSVNTVKPVTKDFTRISYFTFVSDESKLDSGAGADLETVELEDQAVVESVQKGIRSRFYDSGRYSPARELGTHHFHRLICEFMSDTFE